MPTSQTPILYIKSGCPWCTEALAYFKSHSVKLDVREVRTSKADMKKMVEISGQKKTPTFVLGDFVVADFDVGEFSAALNKAPSIKEELGIR